MRNTKGTAEEEGTQHEPPHGTVEVQRDGDGEHAHDGHDLTGDIQTAWGAYAVCHHAGKVAENHGGAAHDGQHEAGQASAALGIKFLHRRRQEG